MALKNVLYIYFQTIDARLYGNLTGSKMDARVERWAIPTDTENFA